MNYPKAFIIAAALIAGAIAFSVNAKAGESPEGRFQILNAPFIFRPVVGNVKKFPGVWRLDVTTGQIVHCYAAWVKGENRRIQCLKTLKQDPQF